MRHMFPLKHANCYVFPFLRGGLVKPFVSSGLPRLSSAENPLAEVAQPSWRASPEERLGQGWEAWSRRSGLGFAFQVRHMWAARITHLRTPALSPVPCGRACGSAR